MKVLVVHNRYRSLTPSGENQVVDSDIAAMRERGVTVVPYIRDSDEIESWSPAKQASLAVLPTYSRKSVHDIRSLIADDRPDVLHLHNPYPLVSPAVINVAVQAGIPVVQSVHNHRHVCVKGIYFRDGKLCQDCLGKTIPWPAVAHGCYQDSRIRTVPMATALVVHRRTWRRVARYLALTPQMVTHLLSAGIPASRITVRPNTAPDPGPPDLDVGDGFLFAGRLSEEKGVSLLVDAWRRHPDQSLGTLTVLGDGPQRGLVETLATERTDVRTLGRVAPAVVAEEMRATGAVVVPSTCPEAFPMVVVEAFANGRPVIGTALGGLPGIVEPGVGSLVAPEVDAFATALADLPRLNTPAVRAAARARYEQLYSPGVVHDQLLEIYDAVRMESSKRKSRPSETKSHT
ncbi:MAG: glycosyltransferase [Actinomycetota bacterium]